MDRGIKVDASDADFDDLIAGSNVTTYRDDRVLQGAGDEHPESAADGSAIRQFPGHDDSTRQRPKALPHGHPGAIRSRRQLTFWTPHLADVPASRRSRSGSSTTIPRPSPPIRCRERHSVKVRATVSRVVPISLANSS